MEYRNDRHIECPFYKRGDQKWTKIICEGGEIRLPGPELREFELRYCAGGWRYCGIARMLELKWARK